MIHELWHLLPYIVFGFSMGSSAVHYFRRQFPRNEEPPPFPKAYPARPEIGDPALGLFATLSKAPASIMAHQNRQIRQESLILITTVAVVSISSVIVKVLGGRNA